MPPSPNIISTRPSIAPAQQQQRKRGISCVEYLNAVSCKTAYSAVLRQRCRTALPLSRPFVKSSSSAQRSMVYGFSMYDLNACSHSAPAAPSTTRWSQLSVTIMVLISS